MLDRGKLDIRCSAQVFLCPGKLLTCVNLQKANSVPQRLSALSKVVTFWFLLQDKAAESFNAFSDDSCNEFCNKLGKSNNLRPRQIGIA